MFNSISVLVLDYIVIRHFSIPVVLLVGLFIYWMIFYFYGLYLSNHEIKLSYKYLLLLSIILFPLQIIEAYFIGVGLKISSWVWAFAFLSFLFSPKVKQSVHKHKNIFSFFSLFGRYSFGIYLSHVYVLLFVNSFSRFNSWIVNCSCTFCITFLTIYFMDLLVERKYTKIMGLK